MSRWTDETGISPRTRARVMDRDGRQCVICLRTDSLQCAHVVRRSRGGKGVETNLVMLCQDCHRELDFDPEKSKVLHKMIVDYLTDIYGEWDEKDQIFSKSR